MTMITMAKYKNISSWVKAPVKFLVRSRERKRIFKEINIRKKQDEEIKRYNAQAEKLIVFMVPGADILTGTDKISGGIISIVSLCEESARLKEIHGAEVIMCTMANEHLLWHHTQFANKTDVFRHDQLRSYFTGVKEIIIHLPEYTCIYFLENLGRNDLRWLKQIKQVHINIMNQNVLLMPEVNVINQLKQLATKVTATTAHQKYCNQHYRQLYNIPLHKFSVWISPEKYTFKKYGEKENLMVVSPDEHPTKEIILNKLAAIPGLQVQIIRNLTYEQYKNTIARAKWALTFGEGLDGYIIEPAFSGAVGFAVYNENFFTSDFEELPTIYGSYEQLLQQIVSDIERLNDEQAFSTCQSMLFSLCAKYYSQSTYEYNIRSFYEGHYTLP
jgi:hypothetical protein